MTTKKEYKGIKVDGVAKGKANWSLYLDYCKGCGLCLEKCPVNKGKYDCLNWSKEVGIYATPAVQPDAEKCTGCGICASVCPDNAIRIDRV
jgi:2-oxoglutarate ferredoxin oxidoreductase subunit delta